MRKKLFILSFIASLAGAKAQNGLEDIIVEKYYISEANDTNANAIGGNLPIGSVTYRIYVDMLPGYNFQAAFGLPGQELRIETSTLFFNNMDYGNTFPTFSKNNSAKNTVMLDSWLSVGGACNGHFGVLKTDDDGQNTNVNSCSGCSAPQILQSTNVDAGIPLLTQDGLLAGNPVSVTAVGLSSVIGVFGNSTNGNLFLTDNGSWAALGGAVGPDTATNRVLIAQITTDGVLTFKLNIQIGTPGGGTEQYVATNPTGSQIQLASLIYDSSNITNLQDLMQSGYVYKIYPNPAKEVVQVEFRRQQQPAKKSQANFNVFSLDGKVMLSKVFLLNDNFASDTIDVSALPQGVYYLQMNVDGVVSTKKLIKI
ncbi:MAG: T9SS type A sorting domain-containing protein [Bacteroidota bacterium]|jgi:hypothetical protein